MRILCIYPGMDERVNDNFHVLEYLKEHGIDVTVICSRSCGLKSKSLLPDFETMKGIPVYRIYDNFEEQASFPVKNYAKVLKIARQSKPELIYCSHQFNMSIAEKLAGALRIPVILFVEFARKPERVYKRRYYLGIKSLAPVIGNIHWLRLTKRAKAIITSYPNDMKYVSSLSRYGTQIYYIPWCNHIPPEIYQETTERKTKRGIYVGSLVKWKNVEEFTRTVPCILDRTPTDEFIIIGPTYNVNIVETLKKKYGKKICYRESLPREEALKLINQSFFSYTPVKYGGWGFIGDSWAMKTPLVATHDDYNLHDGVDAMLVKNIDNIGSTINKLYKDSRLYGILQEGGYTRYSINHTGESIGKRLLHIFRSL